MENMCIISDNFKNKIPKEIPSHIEVYNWRGFEYINLASFPIIVIDQNIEKMPGGSHFFQKMRKQIINFLKYGGIIICLSYLTLKNSSNTSFGHNWIHDNIGNAKLVSGEIERNETCYDWLPENFAGSLGLLDYDTGIIDMKNIKFIKPGIFQTYFNMVKKVHKELKNFSYNEGKSFFTYSYYDSREGRNCSHKESFELIAGVKHSSSPIAAIIQYNKGKIVFLPQSTQIPEVLIYRLHEIGMSIYDEQDSSHILEERPEWIEDYISDYEKDMVSEIQSKKDEIEKITDELIRVRSIDRLLYSTGSSLEDGIEELFKEFQLNFNRSTEHEPYDFIICDILDSGKVFIEVTGEKKIKQDSRKLTQIMATFSRPEFNLEFDKFILLINCQRHKNPLERNLEDIITKEAKLIINRLKTPVITTVELFNIWKDILEKKIPLEEAKKDLKKKFESFHPFSKK